ncbi:synaptobrevin-domain-containing protein [Zopfochytrium polystomum]|nr:synaptobrevin-domain-containing protein [Zopfochytrium polystomum]
MHFCTWGGVYTARTSECISVLGVAFTQVRCSDTEYVHPRPSQMSRFSGGGGGRDTVTASKGAGDPARGSPGVGRGSGGAGGGGAGYAPVRSAEDAKLNQLQQEADVVLNIFRDNVAEMSKRGDALETLHEQIVHLNASTRTFREKSEEVKNKMWWKNMRMTLILSAVCLVLALVLLFPILKATGVIGGD